MGTASFQILGTLPAASQALILTSDTLMKAADCPQHPLYDSVEGRADRTASVSLGSSEAELRRSRFRLLHTSDTRVSARRFAGNPPASAESQAQPVQFVVPAIFQGMRGAIETLSTSMALLGVNLQCRVIPSTHASNPFSLLPMDPEVLVTGDELDVLEIYANGVKIVSLRYIKPVEEVPGVERPREFLTMFAADDSLMIYPEEAFDNLDDFARRIAIEIMNSNSVATYTVASSGYFRHRNHVRKLFEEVRSRLRSGYNAYYYFGLKGGEIQIFKRRDQFNLAAALRLRVSLDGREVTVVEDLTEYDEQSETYVARERQLLGFMSSSEGKLISLDDPEVHQSFANLQVGNPPVPIFKSP